LNTDR
jgi:hypothetical protein